MTPHHRRSTAAIDKRGRRQRPKRQWHVSPASISRPRSESKSACAISMASAPIPPARSSPSWASPGAPGQRDLTESEVLQIRELIDRDYQVEGDLRREVAMNIKRLMDLGCYRGLRHRKACRCAASAPTPTPAPAKARPSRDRRQEESHQVNGHPKPFGARTMLRVRVWSTTENGQDPPRRAPAARKERTSPPAWRTSPRPSTTP
jgi:hypothetical protein